MVTLLQAAEQVSQTIMLGNGPEAAPPSWTCSKNWGC